MADAPVSVTLDFAAGPSMTLRTDAACASHSPIAVKPFSSFHYWGGAGYVFDMTIVAATPIDARSQAASTFASWISDVLAAVAAADARAGYWHIVWRNDAKGAKYLRFTAKFESTFPATPFAARGILDELSRFEAEAAHAMPLPLVVSIIAYDAEFFASTAALATAHLAGTEAHLAQTLGMMQRRVGDAKCSVRAVDTTSSAFCITYWLTAPLDNQRQREACAWMADVCAKAAPIAGQWLLQYAEVTNGLCVYARFDAAVRPRADPLLGDEFGPWPEFSASCVKQAIWHAQLPVFLMDTTRCISVAAVPRERVEHALHCRSGGPMQRTSPVAL
jgi:hypothetical protein